MAKKDYFLIVDTETTQNFSAKYDNQGNELKPAIPAMVADFGAVIVDRKGNEYSRCAAMVSGVYGEFPLFYSSDPQDEVFGKHTLDRRYLKYQSMLESGRRILASVNAINRWLDNVRGKYDPILTAYNLAFDIGKCDNTGIDLTNFDSKFCLMKAAQDKWAHRKDYLQMVLDTHSFNPPTKKGNMSFQTKAEIMTRYVLNDPYMDDEPHTALEDALYYELPILLKLVKSTKRRIWMNPRGITWQSQQVRDWYQPK